MLVKSRPPKNLFYVLDGIRGIGALFVALYHTADYFRPQRFQESYLAVDIFFLLSGTVLANAYEKKLLSGLGTWRFALIRIIRIYPFYLIGCLITILGMVGGVLGEVSASSVVLFAFLALFIFPNPGPSGFYPLNGPSWTLMFEMISNVAYAAFIKFMNVRTLATIMSVSAIGIAIGIAMSVHHNVDFGYTAKGFIFGFCRVGYSFFAGVLIYRIYETGEAPRITKLGYDTFATWVLLVLTTSVLMASPSGILQSCFDFVAVIFVFPALVYVALWFQPVGITGRLCRFFGIASYPIYAVHAPLGTFVRAYLENVYQIKVQDYAPWAGFAFLALLMTLCLTLYKIYDIPLRRYLLSHLDLHKSRYGR